MVNRVRLVVLQQITGQVRARSLQVGLSP